VISMDFAELDKRIKSILDFLSGNEQDCDTILYDIKIDMDHVGVWYKGEI